MLRLARNADMRLVSGLCHSYRSISHVAVAQYSTHHSRPLRHPDIIVVGSGIAGVSASIAAAEKGASVLMVDRSHGGGATALSGGVVYAGGGTRQQREAGSDDTPENMYAYLRQEVGDAVDENTLRMFCDRSVEQLEWLEKHGARFEASLCPYKTSYPTDRHYLYYSGSEKSYPFDQKAKPAPRGHRMVHPGFSGAGLSRALLDSAKKLGVQFVPATKVERVLFDSKGAVSGVRYRTLPQTNPKFDRHRKLTQNAVKFQLTLPPLAALLHRRASNIWDRHSEESEIHAPAVVLAAGGFAFNPEMRKKYLPEFFGVAPLGTPGDDGSGIMLGLAAGGSTSHLDRMTAWRFLYPPTALLEGVVVDKGGERLGSEDIYGARLTERMVKHAGSKSFLILDSSQWEKAKSQLPEQTSSFVRLQRTHWLYWAHQRANSLQELAAKLGVSPDGLDSTVQSYNSAIASGQPDLMHKTPELCTPILKGPFYAIDISAVDRTGPQAVLGLTLGGLRVDGETGLVLTDQNKKISGLYAAGRTAVGICSNGYISGLSLADGVFSGKRAAEHAMGGDRATR